MESKTKDIMAQMMMNRKKKMGKMDGKGGCKPKMSGKGGKGSALKPPMGKMY